ncbi:MAG: Adenosylhomocysteinase [Methanonatronarchaeales archaeon]|nr:Adenosylhomocysteinase [Methanonatronarchaeales archaeon]
MTVEEVQEGEAKVGWAREHMPVLARIRKRLEEEEPFGGVTVGMALHVEPKTAVLVETLRAGGAEVAITGCNPLSTQDDVARYLDTVDGIACFAEHGVDEEEYYEAIDAVLDREPSVVIDDGGDLVFRLHEERRELLDGVEGGCEETTTGVHRLRAMERDGALELPVVAVNDTPMKRNFDNRHGTGESTLSAVMSTTNLQVGGKTVVVAGYGNCGRGLAEKFAALGARVIVTEVDPRRALQAHFGGYDVKTMDEAAAEGDLFVTTTGNVDVVTGDHFDRMRDGAVVCNAGHFNVEINLDDVEEMAEEHREPRPGLREYTMPDGRNVSVLAEGRLVNLAAPLGWGHPVEIMDLSFAIQALSAEYVLREDLEPGVIEVPDEIDVMVAELKLRTSGIAIDRMTEEQRDYFESWRHGT